MQPAPGTSALQRRQGHHPRTWASRLPYHRDDCI